ncbi:MAG: hypothetical protein ABSD98_04575 [Candidatus Korobacteraceae bacterium]
MRQEAVAEANTEASLADFLAYFERSLDLLIEMLYATPALLTLSTEMDEFKSQARPWFHSSFCTFRASVILSNRGYYFEAQILHRHLIEILVKLRYFFLHPEKLKTFDSLATKKKARITWKAMFDEVLPGYYDEYSWSMSYVAHGGVGANAYRVTRDASGFGTADAGVAYKEFWAGAFANQTTVFLLGFLRTYQRILADSASSFSPELQKEISDVEALLESAIQSHIQHFGRNNWHDIVEPIWKY